MGKLGLEDNKFKNDVGKNFYKIVIALSIPMMIQNLLSSCLGMVDTLMIGRIGESEIAASGIANQYLFLYNLIIWAIGSGCGVFIPQLMGKKDYKGIRKVVAITVILGCIVASIFMVATLVAPQGIMRLYTQDTDVVVLGTEYLRIVSLSLILFMISNTFATAARCIQETKIPMVASVAALITNTALNGIFIFGLFGIEPMGIKGAAIATLISRVIECALILIMIYGLELKVRIKFIDLFSVRKELIKSYFKQVVPILLNDSLWGLATSVCTAAYCTLGTDAMVSVQIGNTVTNIFFTMILAVGSAVGIVIGNQIGKGEEEDAYKSSIKSLKVAFSIGIITGLLLFIIAPYVVKVFNVQPTTQYLAINVIRVLGIAMMGRSVNYTFAIGIFRAGGDVKYIAILELVSIWSIAVPIAVIGAKILQLPIYIVLLLVSIEEYAKIVIELKRIKSKKWINNLTEFIEIT